MITPNIDSSERIELGALCDFVAQAKGTDYESAEASLHYLIFEGCHICDDDADGYSLINQNGELDEIVAYMKNNNISALEVYQDC